MTSRPTTLLGFWRGVLVSLLFWTALVAAAGMFAAVSLSPKLVTVRALSLQHHDQQWRLLQLERQTDQLSRVVSALEQDPQFAAELARLEFDALRPGEEVLAVESTLRLDPSTKSQLEHPTPQQWHDDVWLQRWLTLATSETWRQTLLASAVVLILFAFTFLQEPLPARSNAAPAGPGRLGRMLARYRTASPAE